METHIPQIFSLLTLLVHFASAGVEVSTKSYFSEPIPASQTSPVAATNLTLWGARSDVDCALTCSLDGNTCRAFAFMAATKTCVASALWNANFSAIISSSLPEVFRDLSVAAAGFRDTYAQIGNRTFRVIQQRSNGALSFARNWTDYEDGFGDDTNFWLGLKSINSLTNSTPRVFRMEAVTQAGVLFVDEYSGFTVGGVNTNYSMTFSSYLTGSSNTTSDSLNIHKGMQFSTVDRDNDINLGNCALGSGGGGFWFGSCATANPTGIYKSDRSYNDVNMFLYGADTHYPLKSIRLMLQV